MSASDRPRRRRHVLATLAAFGLSAAGAAALPGDPPPLGLTPPDKAGVAANAAGIPVTFSCPTYRKDVYGEADDPTTDYGTSEDYSVRFSPSPDVDSDGLLGNEYTTMTPITASGDTCSTALDTEASGTSPDALGGTVYWQVYRSCVGCTPQFELSPVRSFTVTAPKIASSVEVPDRVFAGYLTKVEVTTQADVAGGRLALQRKQGKTWHTIATADAFKGDNPFFVRLGKGKQTLRGVLTTVGGVSPGTPKDITARPDRNRTTSGRDDGTYREASAHAAVEDHGRFLTGFTTPVTATCFGATVEQNHVMILFAGIDRSPIAPDGSVTAVLETKSKGARVEVTGTVHHGHFKGEASIYIKSSRCSGVRKVDLKRR